MTHFLDTEISTLH